MLGTDFTILQITRNNFKELVSSHSLDQLNKIPDGFNNNLMWNLGHIIVTQQLLCYKLSGLPMQIDNEYVEKYRKGSRPNMSEPVSKEEFDFLIDFMQLSQDRMNQDYQDRVFKDYTSYTTSYNMTLNNIEDAIRFNNVHESMHLGTCLVLQKFV